MSKYNGIERKCSNSGLLGNMIERSFSPNIEGGSDPVKNYN